MAVTVIFAGEIAKELLKQLILISAKSRPCRNTADNLISLIEAIQPTIREIQYSGVELPAHRQAQIGVLIETLEEGKKLTEKVLSYRSWNMFRQITLARKMEKLERKFIDVLKTPILTYILADVHLLRANSDVRLDRVDKSLDKMCEQLGSMKIGGEGLIMEDLGVGLELGKRKVKKMMFDVEGGLFGIIGIGGVGKTTLARALERDDEVRCHFENRILFLTVSQSPILEELRAHIWGFLSGYEGLNPLPNWNFQFEGMIKTRKLVILDDVWTREALGCLMYNFPGCTTLVISRSKLTDPKTTYDVELLREDEAISLFCLSAFGQKSVPPGFNKSLVKQVADECKGVPLALKVIGASLNDRPEKYWEGAHQRLSRGEPADETDEARLLRQMEASLENLDPKTRECFLDLGAFPEDKKIPLDVLINMWIEVHDLEERNAFAILVDLSDKNLLTLAKDIRVGSLYTSYYDRFVTQHDVLRDLALHLCNRGEVNKRRRLLMPKRELVPPREWERNNDEPYIAQIVSIHTGEMNEKEWFDMDFPKAEVLILNFSSDKYVLPPFITKMSRLRVLVIINNGMSHAVLHGFSIFANLSKLRSLWLEKVHVPELSNTTIPLKNLHKISLILCKISNSFDQTEVDLGDIFPNLGELTIDHCDDLVSLPTSICGMTSLNSLSIKNCPRLCLLPKKLSKLQSLEILRLYACPELKSLPVEEICELPRLECLDMSQCVSLDCLPEEIGNLMALKKTGTPTSVDLSKMIASCSSSVQVFINFRGEQPRMGFVSHLVKALEKDGINVFIDENETRGEDLTRLFNRIEESRIAIAVFSSMYTESKWCLNELEKIKECVELGKLVVIPIFYKIKINDVRHMEGLFGDKFRRLARKYGKEDKWREAVEVVSKKFGVVVDNKRKESEFVDQIVGEVMKVLNSHVDRSGKGNI